MSEFISITDQLPPTNQVVVVLDEDLYWKIHKEYAAYRNSEERYNNKASFRLCGGYGWFDKWRLIDGSESAKCKGEIARLRGELKK